MKLFIDKGKLKMRNNGVFENNFQCTNSCCAVVVVAWCFWMGKFLSYFKSKFHTKARFTSKQNLLKLCLSMFFCSNAQFHSNKIWANDQKTCSKAKNNAQKWIEQMKWTELTYHLKYPASKCEFENWIHKSSKYTHKLSNDHMIQGLLCLNTTVVHGNGR